MPLLLRLDTILVLLIASTYLLHFNVVAFPFNVVAIPLVLDWYFLPSLFASVGGASLPNSTCLFQTKFEGEFVFIF
jgi:hypothetical protein